MAFNVVKPAAKSFPTKQTLLTQKSLKVKMIAAKELVVFETQLNEFASTHNVKFTQTHVQVYTHGEGCYTRYTAAVFYD